MVLVFANGPPTWPVAEKPVAGETPKGSGGPVKASISASPVGVPQPVHRSYPATALNKFGLTPLKLLPVVMS